MSDTLSMHAGVHNLVHARLCTSVQGTGLHVSDTPRGVLGTLSRHGGHTWTCVGHARWGVGHTGWGTRPVREAWAALYAASAVSTSVDFAAIACHTPDSI